MDKKRILFYGLATGVLFLIFDIIIAMVTMPLFVPYSNLPVWKTPPDTVSGAIFDLINGIILVGVYAVINKGIPGSGWVKGMNYGIMVGLFRVVMMSFSITVMYDIPPLLVAVGLLTGYVEVIALCIIVSLMLEKHR